MKRTSKGVKVSFKNEKIEEAKRYWGYFVLVSNEIRDPFEALKAYRSREKIEELFATYKDSFDGRKPRTWYRKTFTADNSHNSSGWAITAS